MKKVGLGLSVVLLFFTAFSVFAAEAKFVVIDLQTVINGSKAGQHSISQLKKKFQSSFAKA